MLERFFWCVALSANIWAEYNALGFFLRQVTNDIFTEEDGEFLVKHGALAPERICAVQTGGCPHAAIREDISINLGPLEELSQSFKADILLCESGGGTQDLKPFKTSLIASIRC